MSKKKRHSQQPQKRICVLCGQPVPSYRTDCVIGATGRVACNNCLQIAQKVALFKAMEDKSAQPSKVEPPFITPQGIMAKLERSIIGQRAAKEAVALLMWKQMLRANGDKTLPRCNLLLHGPTGCGKTALVEAAAKLVDLPVRVVDTTTITQTGYRGKDPTDIVIDYIKAHEDHPNLQHGIIFLDEFDKIAGRQGNTNLAEYNRGTQHGFLKLVEGIEVKCEEGTVNTANLMFIFGGAFTALQKKAAVTPTVRPIGFSPVMPIETTQNEESEPDVADFTAFGMEPEIMGRIGQIVRLNPLSEEDLTKIILESDLSVFSQYRRFFAGYGIDLTLGQKAAESIAQHAAMRGTGARGLNAHVEELVAPLLMSLAEGRLSGSVDLLEGGKHSAAS